MCTKIYQLPYGRETGRSGRSSHLETAVPVAVNKDIAVTLVERQCAGGYGNNQAETNTRQHRMVRRDP